MVYDNDEGIYTATTVKTWKAFILTPNDKGLYSIPSSEQHKSYIHIFENIKHNIQSHTKEKSKG